MSIFVILFTNLWKLGLSRWYWLVSSTMIYCINQCWWQSPHGVQLRILPIKKNPITSVWMTQSHPHHWSLSQNTSALHFHLHPICCLKAELFEAGTGHSTGKLRSPRILICWMQHVQGTSCSLHLHIQPFSLTSVWPTVEFGFFTHLFVFYTTNITGNPIESLEIFLDLQQAWHLAGEVAAVAKATPGFSSQDIWLDWNMSRDNGCTPNSVPKVFMFSGGSHRGTLVGVHPTIAWICMSVLFHMWLEGEHFEPNAKIYCREDVSRGHGKPFKKNPTTTNSSHLLLTKKRW